MTNKINWERHRSRQQMDAYFRSTDWRVRFGHDLTAKQEKDIREWDKKHPEHNVKQQKHIKAIKLASKLYKVLKTDPLFVNDNKTELWQMALTEAKKKIK